MSTIRIDEDGVFVDGERHEPGWRKGWLFENTYGWEWIGPFRWNGMVDLLVLPFDAEDPKLRAEIEARFTSAKPPNGEPEFSPR